MPGLQHSHQHDVSKDHEILAHSGLGDTERTRRLGAVPELSMGVGDKPEKALDRGGWKADTEVGQVACHQRPDVVASPADRRRVVRREERPWESTSKPELVESFGSDITDAKTTQLEDLQSTRERFGCLAECDW